MKQKHLIYSAILYFLLFGCSNETKKNAIITSEDSFAVGENHTCWIKGGKAFCAGDNSSFQLGSMSNAYTIGSLEVEIPTGCEAKEISSAGDYSCLLTKDKDVWCWGRDRKPYQIETPREIVHIAVGRNHACALGVNNNIWCWGDNNYGQLGNGTTENSSLTNVIVPEDTKFNFLSVGPSQSCALDINGKPWCWGGNYDEHQTEPTKLSIPAETQFNYLTTFGADTCALDDASGIWCWNHYDGNVPTKINSGENQFSSISFYYNNNNDDSVLCGIGKNDGKLFCKNGATFSEKSVVSQPVEKLKSSAYHSCMLVSDGELYCIGKNQFGQLGNENFQESETATKLFTENQWNFISIESYSEEICGLKDDGKIYCLGSCKEVDGVRERVKQFEKLQMTGDPSFKILKDNCMVADNDDVYCYDPQHVLQKVEVLNGFSVEKLNIGGISCAFDESGNNKCWSMWPNIEEVEIGEFNGTQIVDACGHVANIGGQDYYFKEIIDANGDLWQVTNDNEPVKRTGGWSVLTKAKKLFCFYRSSCVIDENDSLYCWSTDYLDGDYNYSQWPEKVEEIDGIMVSSVGDNYMNTCAISIEGDLFCWGNNESEQIGYQDQDLNNIIMPAGVDLKSADPGGIGYSGYNLKNYNIIALSNHGKAYYWGNIDLSDCQ